MTIIFSRPFKKHLGGMHFASDEEVTAAMNKFLREAIGEWYNERIKMFVAQLQKYIKGIRKDQMF